MALTVEERLKRLDDMEGWPAYTPEQKVFITAIAKNIDPERAYALAFPEKKNARFHAGRLMQYRSVKDALAVICYEKPKPVYTKQEALEDLTYRMRKQGMEDETYVKLLAIYSRMNGWDKPKADKPEEEVDPLTAVLAAEKKRRENANGN